MYKLCTICITSNRNSDPTNNVKYQNISTMTMTLDSFDYGSSHLAHTAPVRSQAQCCTAISCRLANSSLSPVIKLEVLHTVCSFAPALGTVCNNDASHFGLEMTFLTFWYFCRQPVMMRCSTTGHSAKNDLSIEVLRDFCTRETFLRSVPGTLRIYRGPHRLST
jgi:hypothetical protein